MKDYIITSSGTLIKGYQDVSSQDDFAEYKAYVKALRTARELLIDRMQEAVCQGDESMRDACNALAAEIEEIIDKFEEAETAEINYLFFGGNQ